MCYCHMDIKPQNIVVFGDHIGVWKVIDFGISTIRKANTLAVWTRKHGIKPYVQRFTHTVGTDPKQLKGIYQAPEVNSGIQRAVKNDMDEVNGKAMGRRSDIWSLGCILGEVLAANLGMRDRLHAQMKQRYEVNDDFLNGFPFFFYEPNRTRCWELGSRYKLNEGFRDGLHDLRHSSNSRVVLDSTKLVENMVAIKRTSRWKSDRVVRELGRILRQEGRS